MATSAGAVAGLLTVLAGGGQVAATLTATAVLPSFTVTASCPYVRTEQQCQMHGTLDGAVDASVAWSLQPGDTSGASISSDGLMTAPKTVPLSGNVTVTARSVQFPEVTAGLTLPIWYALPTLQGSLPLSLDAGTTSAIMLQGTALDRTSALTVNGLPVQYQAVSANQLQAIVSLKPWSVGALQVVATSPGLEGGTSNTLVIPIKQNGVPFDTAARFLQQAGFGATTSLVTQVQKMGLAAWIDQQMATPPYNFASTDGIHPGQYYRETQDAAHILRQRVSMALGQIYVIGNGLACVQIDCGPYWESLIERDAFGDIGTLLRDVSLNPIMGAALDNAGNGARNSGATPNQNFARELLQLMTIGPTLLRQDGTTVLDSDGKSVPTYDQSNVVAMAAALSGWLYADPTLTVLQAPLTPLVPDDDWHDVGRKNILPGVVLPPGQSTTEDFAAVINTLVAHPNVGPFLSRRLIQHLVKSNPSADYVARVSQVFASDDGGTRGNLAAVVKAILLDPEARAGDDPTLQDPTAGHLMEPMLYLASVLNSVGGTFTDDQVRDVDGLMAEHLYSPDTVFSFYEPDHQLPDGTPSPEAQLLDNAHATAKMAIMYNIFHSSSPGTELQWSKSPFWDSTSADDLLDRLNHLLYHGIMSSGIRKALSDYMQANPKASMNDQLPDVVFLAVSNSSYQVIR